MMNQFSGILALTLASVGAFVKADTIVFTTETAYNAGLLARGLTSVTTQNFDSLTSGTSVTTGTTLGAFTFTGMPATGVVDSAFTTTSGLNYLTGATGGQFSAQGFGFTFAAANAVSMKIITSEKPSPFGTLDNLDFTLSAGGQSVNLSTADATNVSGVFPISSESYFFGIINTDAAFSSATFAANTPVEGLNYFVDDLTTAVPEPGSLAILLLTGTALVNFRRRTRRR